MPLFAIKGEIEDDLEDICNLDLEVLKVYADLAFKGLRRGLSVEEFKEIIGERDADEVETELYCVTEILREATRSNVTLKDFEPSMQSIGFNADAVTMFKELYEEYLETVRSAHKGSVIEMSQYHGFDWDFNVMPKTKTDHTVRMEYDTTLYLKNDGIMHQLNLAMDPVVMSRLNDSVNAAIKESKSAHSRKILRCLK
eukprot:TRINITY_DN41139_c0_g1_i1.p1 TRINITY_DN41139_c0_g1~~TRINITY_DN41139_c0_g1_i1.p1  ORF type:complete len:198 (-),score=40.84 TRINITY_DN41139_c0_g1_i1:49-642(-)